jgi:esterase
MSLKLAFEAVGNGPPVVVLHGLFGSGRNWASIAKALGDTHRIYLPDARNHGASPWAESMSYADMAHDVLALIEHEQLERPLLIGHSMGGKTAMTLALEQPQLIAGVAVIDIAPERYADQFSPYVSAMRGLNMVAATNRSEIRQALASHLDAGAPVDFLMQNLRRHDERFDWRLNLMAVAKCMHDLCAFPPQPAGRRYGGPALFASGAASDYVLPAMHARIRQLFPRARLASVAEAGHWVHADQPAALVQTLQRWLCETRALATT